ncbi:BTAD domain-containing putative transcriptional regulator [Amycolatopsis keratiniphila]|uniref:AfsR/SARP family transcriptional regulator n=1 Tax=Amycolatopsis keratiniphila TaxID=129921 RepID=UPI0033EE2F61
MATVAGTHVPLRSTKMRIVLASLLLRANQVVTLEELIDRLWDNAPPRGARNAAQSYVMRLRNTLGSAGALIQTRHSGYLIETTPEMVDVSRFYSRLTASEAARTALDPGAEARELRAALALWRGAALSDVPSEFLRGQEFPQLTEARLQAQERLADVELMLGRHIELIGELYTLTDENPLRERFWAQLMVALHRSDRQADALAAYRRVSTLLRDQLGIDPGDALKELNQRILVNDQTLTRAARQNAQHCGSWTAPFQLPADVPDFVGRSDLLVQIRDLTTGPPANGLAVPIGVLTGPPGVGKTAVAVHAAHTLRSDFPDGQLYVNMRGYSSSPPLAAADALARFLRSLGVSPESMPHDVDEQSTLLRSLLRGRKVFVVLDNAVSPDQVRPLLPSDPSCAVLVTSRNNLHGLTALNGARRLPVDVVPMKEATMIIANIIGAERAAAEPEATSALATACGFFPLSLRIAATNLAESATRSVGEYVAKLSSNNRLDEFEIEGDSQAAVRLAFDFSYSTLKPVLSRFFRAMSLIPGPDFDERAAAAVAGLSVADSRRILGQLTMTNMLASRTSKRFLFHDLIKEFANERAREQDGASEQSRVIRRLFGYYLHWANSACRLLYPDAHIMAIPDQERVTPAPMWADSTEAIRWLDSEAENLIAIIHAASATDLPVWALADTLLAYLQRQRHDSIGESAFTSALAAAERFGDNQAQAAMHRGLGRLQFQQTRYADAEAHMTRAVQLFQASGDVAGEARARTGLGAIALETDAYDRAIECYEQSLRLIDASEDAAGRCTTLFNLGVTLIHMGRTTRGKASLAKSEELAHEASLSHLLTRRIAVLALSDMWHGDLGPALQGFSEALDTWRTLKYRPGVIETVRNIAEISWEARRYDVALDLGFWALAEAQKIQSPWLIVGSHIVIGNSMLVTNDVETATRHLDDARILANDKLSYWIPAAKRSVATCRRRLGFLTEAITLATELTADIRPRERGRAHTELSAGLLARGDSNGAIDHARQGCEIAARHGYRLDQARALQTLATAQTTFGDSAAALHAEDQAKAVFELADTNTKPFLDELVARVSAIDADTRA